MEIRLHGRGGQGGVTCAKILAAVFSHLGKSVQAFGDYAGERSGAPIRAYTRVSDTPVENRNKVYQPDHLVVLDQTLLTDDLVAGLVPGGTLILNTPESPESLAERFGAFRIATVDATRIARAHKIGSRSVVIVNTTIAGAIARVFDLPLSVLEETYQHLKLGSNLAAATEAYAAVRVAGPWKQPAPVDAAARPAPLPTVLPLEEHVAGAPTGLRTGSWRTQAPSYVTNLAPCNAFCPAGNDVVGFVQALAKDGPAAAAQILGATTPFSAVCGRVCPAPCMDGCNRRELDGAVDVRGLERWVADHHPVARKSVEKSPDPKRFGIVGGGPAGLSAAYQLALAGHEVTVFDAEEKLGGVLRTGIPAYRLPRAELDKEIDGILALGVKARCGTAIRKDRLDALRGEYDALLLATGLQRNRAAGVPGEELEGVQQGIHFLHRLNSGQPVKLTGHVVVLGGGNTAMDCARSALRCGAQKVTVAYRRTRAEMPAIAEEIEHAAQEGIIYAFLRAPHRFVGEGRVRGVELAKVELGPPDASGRRSPKVTDQLELLECDTVLLALGQSADLSLLPEGWTLDQDGRVSAKGAPLNVFASGDVSTNEGTVTHAIGSGRRAATLAMAALGLPVQVFQRPDRARAVKSTDVRLEHFGRVNPADHRMLVLYDRGLGFEEVDGGLADAREAQRCFSCGHCTQCDTCLVYCPEGIITRKPGGYEIDHSFCKGCGICVTECPRKSMEMSLS